MQRGNFSLIDHKMSKLQGTELRRIWDILERLYNTERLRIYCDVVRTTFCGRICKGNDVKKTLWERRFEKDVVRKMLWKSRCEKDLVRKSLWEIHLFWSSFYWQIFAIKIVLHRLGALHLWCLCLYIKIVKWVLKPNRFTEYYQT